METLWKSIGHCDPVQIICATAFFFMPVYCNFLHSNNCIHVHFVGEKQTLNIPHCPRFLDSKSKFEPAIKSSGFERMMFSHKALNY